MPAVLEAERQFFEANRNDLVQRHEGQYVLVLDDSLVGVFPTAEDAYAEGLARFGIRAFLVKKILRNEPVAFVPVLSVSPAHGGL